MPIDTIVIEYDHRDITTNAEGIVYIEQTLQRSSSGADETSITRLIDANNSPHPYAMELVTIQRHLATLGYTIGFPDIFGRRGIAYIESNHLNTRPVKFDAFADSNNQYLYVRKITINPYHFSTFQEFWMLMIALDDLYPGVFMTGRITRIDYACDYRTDINNIMRGLFINRRYVVSAYTDVETDEDTPANNLYYERQWDRGSFRSFRIGGTKKSTKIYDKKQQELNKIRQIRQDYAEEHDLDMQALIEKYERRMDKTRIEVSLFGREAINLVWHPEVLRDDIGSIPPPRLRDLVGHLERIRNYECRPFEGILINHINYRGRNRYGQTFRTGTRDAFAIRSDIDQGLFINRYHLWRTRENSFWDEHEQFFEIFHWPQEFQPSDVFVEHLNYWSSRRRVARTGKVIPRRYNFKSDERRVTSNWPWEVTRLISRPRQN